MSAVLKEATTQKELRKEKDLRRFSVEGDFMRNKATNGMLYAKLQSISTLTKGVEGEEIRYVKASNVNFSLLAEDFDNMFSRQKLSKDFKMLEKLGFVKKSEINGVKVYILPYDTTKRFQLLPLLTVEYLLKVKSSSCVKIFTHLLNSFYWKAEEGKKYNFTVKQLVELIGLNYNQQKNRETIEFILNSLKNEGLIEYKEIYIQLDNVNKCPIKNYQLTKVNLVVKGMEKKTVKKQNKFDEELAKEREEIEANTSISPSLKADFYNWIEDYKEEVKRELILEERQKKADEFFKKSAYSAINSKSKDMFNF